MFKSKVRPIIVPQYEHGRLAGTLAALWGNELFDRPPLDFPAFVEGVALHDWGYGLLDNVPIGEAGEAEWLQVVRRGIGHHFPNPTVDIVVKLHIRRLLSLNPSPERESLIDQIEEHIANRLPETDRSRNQFDWADKITRFCDNVAFDFSFESLVTRTYPVGSKVGSSTDAAVGYQIESGGGVMIDPWPFSVKPISGIVIGYQRHEYPQKLAPVIVPFHVHGRLEND